MERQKVDMFLMRNADNLPQKRLPEIRERLLALDESQEPLLYTLQFKSPSTALMLSIVPALFGLGGLGRIYIGDYIRGLISLLTCGGCVIFAIIDWCRISGVTRRKNYKKLQTVI